MTISNLILEYFAVFSNAPVIFDDSQDGYLAFSKEDIS